MGEKTSIHPVGGIDYPRTLEEFFTFFPDDAACQHYLERLRWPEQFICPGCGGCSDSAWHSSRNLLLCPQCRRQISVTAGTIFESTRKPLRLWFHAMWQLTSQKYGTNALGLQRILGLGSYVTAWAWLHKLRRAMVRPDRDRLFGPVEVDESYVGGEEAGVHGRQTIKKAIVAIAVEMKKHGFGRIRLRNIPSVSGNNLTSFVSDVVQPGAVVQTDGWKGYSQLQSLGFIHEITVLSDSPDPAHVLMPGVHRVAALLKRWILGTLQGGISKKHLPYYLDEFTFRFNRRTSRARGLLFYRLISQAVQTEHTLTHELFTENSGGAK
ncbi:MAG: IS1595 family transposase [Deltaproteobacteria bacterium]|nr:IS1595 family transposase [Deltaproteobacteria bacterium]